MNPYGTWSSPISAQLITSDVVGLGGLSNWDGRLVWLEQRPQEQGRSVLVMDDGSTHRELTPAPFNVRSRVHEYGGGAYCTAGQFVFFVNAVDQNIYRIEVGESGITAPEMVTQGDDSVRFADLVADPVRPRLLAVREAHTTDASAAAEGDTEPENDLVAIDPETGVIEILHAGHDFYASPRITADGARVAFLAWDHPNMPWDGTQLFVADLAGNGGLQEATVVAGGVDESVFQPQWLSPDRLVYACDANGFWNLYSYDSSGVYCIAEDAAEFGLAQWQFGMRAFVAVSERLLVATRIENNHEALVIVDVDRGLVSPLDERFSSYGSLTAVEDGVAFVGGQADALSAVVVLDTATGTTKTIRDQGALQFDTALVATAEQITYRNTLGETTFANLYRPTHPTCRADESERPPLLVMSHGGPTSRASRDLNLQIQYYTSRGWAVLDVDYGGSTGYGRLYRTRLEGTWGVTDVQDCISGVRHLIAEDEIDAGRVAIRGGSAGGYTTLQALVSSNVFGAGASHYGIGDLRALARDTHKFESRYLDGLIGDAFDERSPINHIDRLNCPVAFFQGQEDRVVPPNQAEAMVAALESKGIAVAYLLFAEEGHGFRRAPNIEQSIEAEYLFFARVFGFEPADDLSHAFQGAKLLNAPWAHR